MSDSDKRIPVLLTPDQIIDLHARVTTTLADYRESLRLAQRNRGGRWGFTGEQIETLQMRMAPFLELQSVLAQAYRTKIGREVETGGAGEPANDGP